MDSVLKLDWLSFTFQVSQSDCLDSDGCIVSPFKVFCDNFPELQIMYDDIVFDTGKFHYSHRYLFSDNIEINCCELEKVAGGSVNFDYACKMGVNVSIPSHSLDLFASLLGIDLQEDGACATLLSLLKFRGCTFSRIDFCYDDFSKKYTAFDYGRWWFQDQISTRFRNCDVKGSCGKVGCTFYLGDRKHRMLRIYDKFYESNGVIDSVRYEWEYHSTDAKKLADTIILNGGKVGFTNLLKDWLRVLAYPTSDLKDRSAVATLPEWDAFVAELSFCEKLVIPSYNDRERSARLNDYVEFHLMPSVRGFVQVNGIRRLLECLIRENKSSQRYEDYILMRSRRGDFYPLDIKNEVSKLMDSLAV